MAKTQPIPARGANGNIYLCPHDGCQYQHDEVGAVRLHYYQQHTEKGQARKKKEQPCDHNYRLLDNRDPIEIHAQQMGYTKICTKCDDIQL